MKKFKQYLTPFLLTIFSFFLRLSLITKGAYHLDCLILLMQSEKSVLDHKIYFAHTHGYPLLSILGALFVALTKLLRIDDPVVGIHLISITFASLCIFVNYFLVKKLFGDLAATLSSLILSLSPIFLSTTVYGNSHAPFLFFLLLGIFYLITYQENHLKKYLVYGAISLGLAGASRIQDFIFMLIPLCLFFFLEPDQNKPTPLSRNKWKDFFISCLIISCIVLLFYLPVIHQKFQNASSSGVSNLISREIFGYVYGLLNVFPFTYGYLLINFTTIGFFLILAGLIFLLIRKKFRLFTTLSSWILFPMMIYSTLGYFVPRYLNISIIPLTMVLGYLLSRGLKQNLAIRFLTIIIVAFMLHQTTIFVFPILQERHQRAVTPEYAQWFAQHTEKDARIISCDFSRFFYYYGNILGIERPIREETKNPQVLQEFKKKVDALIQKGIPVYTTDEGLFSYDLEGHFRKFVVDNYDFRLVGQKLFEDYHRGEIIRYTYLNKVYKMLPKTPPLDGREKRR